MYTKNENVFPWQKNPTENTAVVFIPVLQETRNIRTYKSMSYKIMLF